MMPLQTLQWLLACTALAFAVLASSLAGNDLQDERCPECLADSPPSVQLLQQQIQLSRGANSLLAGPAGSIKGNKSSSAPDVEDSLSAARTLRVALDGCNRLECLRRYVQMPDPAYSWTDTSRRIHGTVGGISWTGAVISLTSQRWLSGEVTPDVWKHALVIISPHGGTTTDTTHGWCTLYVAFGFYGSANQPVETVDETDPNILAAAQISVATSAASAVLFNVPAEWLTFAGDPSQPKIEDAEMAYSWARFAGLSKPPGTAEGDGVLPDDWQPMPERIPELAMTKAVVRAMDTITAFSSMEAGKPAAATQLPQLGGVPLTRFTLFGSSKRGAVCWHAAAVDERVRAIVPLVRSLNLRAFANRSLSCLGGLTATAGDYYKAGIFGSFMHSRQADFFFNVTDPISYASVYAGLPKYIISASNDDFFVPDHTRVWWDAMPGPKWNLMLPNSPHIVSGDQFVALTPTISAFVRHVMMGAKEAQAIDTADTAGTSFANVLPRLDWQISQQTGSITARLLRAADGTSIEPKSVLLWQATTCDGRRRDFRLKNSDVGWACFKCGFPTASGCSNHAVRWSSTQLPEVSAGSRSWLASVEVPRDGRWRAFFIAFNFVGNLSLSTEVSVVPDTFPFRGCNQKNGCNGKGLVLDEEDEEEEGTR